MASMRDRLMSAWLLLFVLHSSLMAGYDTNTNILPCGLRRSRRLPGVPWSVRAKRVAVSHHHSANAVENGLIIARNRRSAVCILSSSLPPAQATSLSVAVRHFLVAEQHDEHNGDEHNGEEQHEHLPWAAEEFSHDVRLVTRTGDVLPDRVYTPPRYYSPGS